MQDEFEKACCRRVQWLFFVVRDCQSLVSPWPCHFNSGLCMRTSCSAGQSAGLDSFVFGSIQTMAGMYYRKWRSEEGEVFGKVALWQVL